MNLKPEPNTFIQRLYGLWCAQTDKLGPLDEKEKAGEVTPDEFEALVGEITEPRGNIEDQIFGVESHCVEDLTIKVKIAGHYDWTIPEFNAGIVADAERLAETGNSKTLQTKAAPKFSVTDTAKRLAQFAEWTGAKAPATVLDADGAPTDELLAFSDAQNLSLDWIFYGDLEHLVVGLCRPHPSGSV